MRDRKRVDLNWRGNREELGGVDTGKTVMKICEKKRKSVFNKRKNNNSN